MNGPISRMDNGGATRRRQFRREADPRSRIPAICLLAMLPATTLAAQEEMQKQHLRWHAEATPEEVVAVLEPQEGASRRFLLEGPRGWRIVVTENMSFDPCSEVTTLRSDSGGWWVRYSREFSFSVQDPRDFLAKFIMDDPADEGHTVTRTIETSQEVRFRQVSPFTAGSYGTTEDGFFAAFLGSPQAPRLAAEIPEDAREMTLFLDHLRHVPTTPEDVYFSRLPAMIARLLRSTGAEDRWPGQEWRCTRTHFLPDRPTFDFREFVSRFQSLAEPER